MLVKRAQPLAVECIVRGYVTGSGWKDYLKTGSVCGHKLPEGLKQCEQLAEPLFTPSTKATEGHDENIDFEETKKIVMQAIAESGAKTKKDLGLVMKAIMKINNGAIVVLSHCVNGQVTAF